MANHKSALKRVGVSEKKNLRNRMITSQVKTAVKSFDKALASEDKAAVESAYVNAVSTVDKAAGKGVIHKNQAANRKSGVMALVNTIVTDEVRAAYVKPEAKKPNELPV